MKNIFEEAFELQEFLLSAQLHFCFIGGLAVQRWGELRTTNDIDLTLLTGFGGEERYVRILLTRYSTRIPNALQMALEARVLLLKTTSGIGIDIALGGLPFEESSIQRATPFEFLPSITLTTCSAEDLIIHKVFANRGKDWSDVEGIMLRQTHLEWRYIEEHLKPLLQLKEEPESWDKLIRLRTKIHPDTCDR